MVRHPPDGPAGAGPGEAPGEAERVAAAEPQVEFPPFAEAFFPQFEEIQGVLDRLSGFALVPVEVPSPDVAAALALYLGAAGRSIHVIADDSRWKTLTAAIVSEPPGDQGAVMVTEPAELSADVRAALRLLNQRRDTVVQRLDTPLVWCGSADFLRLTAEQAPDFWSIREIGVSIVVPPGFSGSLHLHALTFHSPDFVPPKGSISYSMASELVSELREELLSNPAMQQVQVARALLQLAPLKEIDAKAIERMVEIFRESEDTRSLARAQELASMQASSSDAEASLLEAYHLFHQLGDRAGKARCARALAKLFLDPKRMTQAEVLLNEALNLAREIDDWLEEGRSARDLAYIQLQLGNFVRAQALLDVAVRRLSSMGATVDLATAHLLVALLLFATANYERAHREATTAQQIFEDANLAQPLGAVFRILSLIERHLGHPREELTALRRAAEVEFQVNDLEAVERSLQLARSLPPKIAAERDAFIAATEARLAASARS